MPDQMSVWLFTQGVLGFTTAAAMWAAIVMYRGREADRLRYEGMLAKKDEAHDIEVAQWVKLNQDLQATHASDLRTGNDRLAASNDVIRQMWLSRQGATLEKVS